MRWLNALLRPPVRVILITDLIAAPAVIFALNRLDSQHPLALAAYLLSAYALTVTVISFRRIIRRLRILLAGDELAVIRSIKAEIRKHKYTRLYLESREFRAEAGLYAGLAVNLLYAAFKGVTGALAGSPWLGSMGIYYLFLGTIRFALMRGVRRAPGGSTAAVKLHEYRVYRRCGIRMLGLNLAVAGMAVQMIRQNKANDYTRVTVIITAAYTFYSFILSLYNAVSFRKRDNAILSAAKNLALTGACISMLSLQTSMLHVFGSGEDPRFRRTMNSVTSATVIAAVLCIAIAMIVTGTKKSAYYLRKSEEENHERG
ncbi:MAG: hypothetical protein IJ060_11450 [Oscillospiraceae bacterium]|nr:hypothetical protein [Oscillospiraceae bacterium]